MDPWNVLLVIDLIALALYIRWKIKKSNKWHRNKVKRNGYNGGVMMEAYLRAKAKKERK